MVEILLVLLNGSLLKHNFLSFPLFLHDSPMYWSSPPKPTVFISGVIARGDKDFPPAAAQVAHQKPHPSVEKLPHPQHVNQHIHQPRK
ncbi:death-associated protein 1 isoform X9 [Apteryx rowi]|uniref:death-associated protein 1 isoform X9 n=1 Tax=Apteryx rowi TaxID=308060 RepID=UPI000E1C85B8|nr:death-associated protein 1 isoform X9 [Apteryx rowi]